MLFQPVHFELEALVSVNESSSLTRFLRRPWPLDAAPYRAFMKLSAKEFRRHSFESRALERSFRLHFRVNKAAFLLKFRAVERGLGKGRGAVKADSLGEGRALKRGRAGEGRAAKQPNGIRNRIFRFVPSVRVSMGSLVIHKSVDTLQSEARWRSRKRTERYHGATATSLKCGAK
jgi:hypothetical protein